MSIKGEVVLSTQFNWIVQYSDCCKLTSGEKLISPIFTTIIKNTVHRWCFRMRYILSNYLAFSVQNLTKNNVEVTIELTIQNMPSVENKGKTSTVFVKPFQADDGYDTWGCTYTERSVIEDKANNLLANGALTIVCQITQDECDQSMFTSRSEDVHGFETLLDDEKYSDVKFTVDNEIIKAHKCILAKKSDVFAAMFEHDTIEKKQNVVKITDISYNVFKEMLRFLYGGKIDNMKNVAADLLPVANKYLLEELKTICEESLSANLNVENVIEYVCLAGIHNANVLKNKAIQFIVSNAEKVMDKPELKSLSQSHPEVMCNIFRALTKKLQECKLMIKN